MKIRSKILIALVSIVFSAIGCQRMEKVSEPNGDQIKFSPYIGKSGTLTKGAPLTAFAVGDRLKVFAFDDNTGDAFFNDLTVSLYENGTWMYSPLKMWNKNILNFYAYSPVGNANVTANITSAAQTFELTVPADVNNHVDLVAAGNLQLNNVDVPLTFRHLTSRVSFKALKDVKDADKEKVRINSLKINDEVTGGLISEGTFAIDDVTASPIGSWTLGTATAIYEPELTHAASIDLKTTAEAITKDNQSMFLIPQDLANKQLVVDYEFSLDGGFTWTKYTANIKLYGSNKNGEMILPNGFEQGKHYVFTLELKASRTYTFTPTIQAWDDEEVAFAPTSPLSIERIQAVSRRSVERFVITDDSKMGYTIASQADTWMKIGRRADLSFTHTDVQSPWVYADGMTKATGDVGDPAQDWYIYFAPNAGGERRSNIVVTFNDPKKSTAFIQVIQAAGSIADNPVKMTNQKIRIYSTANTAINGIEIFGVRSTDEELTKGTTITVPANVTLASPSATHDITAIETPVVVNLASGFASGSIDVQSADYASVISMTWAKSIGIPSVASKRIISGKYVKAEIIDPTSASWCKLTLDGTHLSNTSTMVSSASAADIFLVAEENPTATERRVAIQLTDASGIVTRDYYYQDPNTRMAVAVKANVGMVYYFGSHAYRKELFKLTSEAAGTYTIASVGTLGISVGGGNWSSAAAGQVRSIQTDFINIAPQDTYITVSATNRSPLTIPVKVSPPISAKGGKVFIPGEYSAATLEGGGAATISNSENDPGLSGLASVTNQEGVWIHYAANPGGVRSTAILLDNATDWRKKTRVHIYQDALLVNYNDDFTEVAHPVKWAGSNVYINEAGLPTFDDVNVTTHSKYQGVLFAWGGLIAIQPTLGTPLVPNGIVWKPEEYAGASLVSGIISQGSSYPSFIPQTTTFLHKPVDGKGDICRYMTEKGLAPAGKKWRMPTSMECSYTARSGFVPVNPYNTANPAPAWTTDAVAGKYGNKDLGRGIIESGAIMAGTFFPAGGMKDTPTKYGSAIFTWATYWSSSHTSAYLAKSATLGINVQTLNPKPAWGDQLYTAGWEPVKFTPIRCVVDEDNTY